MKIVLTGAAGFIGSHTAERLVAEGHEVLGLDNFRTGVAENLAALRDHARFQFRTLDVCDRGRLRQAAAAFRGEAIIHLAALVSVEQARLEPDENLRLNVDAVSSVAQAARDCGARRVIFASSAAIYGDPPEVPIAEDTAAAPVSAYGAAKLASENFLRVWGRDYGFEAVCLRFFNVFGTRQQPGSPYSGVISIFADRIARGLPISVHGDGMQTRDFVSVRDVANGLALAAAHAPRLGGSFNVCTGRETSLVDLIAAMEETIGRRAEVRHESARAGDIRRSVGNPARFETATGFRPAITVAEGLPEVTGRHASR